MTCYYDIFLEKVIMNYKKSVNSNNQVHKREKVRKEDDCYLFFFRIRRKKLEYILRDVCKACENGE